MREFHLKQAKNNNDVQCIEMARLLHTFDKRLTNNFFRLLMLCYSKQNQFYETFV